MLDRDGLRRWVPLLDLSRSSRLPIVGGMVQPRGGTARHDAVASGLARAADRLGVDIIENCPVTGFLRERGRIAGVETVAGTIHASKVALCAAGHSSVLAGYAGLRCRYRAMPCRLSYRSRLSRYSTP